MVICGEWRMDKCDAEKKALTVEEGAVSIGEECWIFNEEVERQAGTYTYCEYVQIKGEFEALTVPNSVTTIMERAFAGHSGLKGLSILSGVTEIGKNAFKGCGSLPYVIAPKVALSSIADPESKEKLAMGYLLHSELFEETLAREYRLYISRQRKKMLALAQKHSLSDAIKKLNPASAEASSLGSAKKKLNAAEAVFQLERKILIGTKQEIAETIKTNRPIEMTARALGLACRCRDSGIVELLLREGFQFDIPDHALMIKYGAEYAPSGKKFPADYALLLVVDNIWNKYLFGYMDRQYNRKEAKLVFKEMIEVLCTDMFSKNLVTKCCSWWVSYDYKSLEACPGYDGPLSIDFYGRLHPKHSNGTVRLHTLTNNLNIITEPLVRQFDDKTDHRLLYRRLGVCANDVAEDMGIFQLNMFVDYEALERDRRLQGAMLEVRRKFGANAIFKGMNLMEGATTLERNRQIGGHKA